jgi:hypothetical protein
MPPLEILEERTVPSTLTVTNPLDSGVGSLRASITGAKSGDTIDFAPSLDGQTITLTSDELTINKSLDIEGPGAGLLAISGNDAFRVFDVRNGNAVVTIAGLTITHGQTLQGSGGGGTLNGGSTLTLTDDVLSFNAALGGGGGKPAIGGAIKNGGGSLTVNDSSFIGNTAAGDPGTYGAEGGAVFNQSSAATFIRCILTGNQAIAGDGGTTNSIDLDLGGGGAIWSEGNSLLTVEQSTFTGNQARGGNGGTGTGSKGFIGLGSGGAILNFGNATLVVDASTFTSNQAIGGSHTSGTGAGLGMTSGGCIQNEGTATITNSSFGQNNALAGNFNSGSGATIVGRGIGGALNNRPVNGGAGTITITGVTFANN